MNTNTRVDPTEGTTLKLFIFEGYDSLKVKSSNTRVIDARASMSKRSYQQYCGVAKALDVVGERPGWRRCGRQRGAIFR